MLSETLCPVLCWGSKHIIIMVSSGLTRSMSQILQQAKVICGFYFDRLLKDTEISVNIVWKGLQYSNQNVFFSQSAHTVC